MRIAVAALKKHENSEVSPIGGRAPFYLIFENRKLVKSIKNPFTVGGGGAGFGVAQMLANEGIKLVICGKFGQNMQSALKEKGIKTMSSSSITAKKVIENYYAKTKKM